MPTKQCTKCGRILDDSQFYNDRNECKSCWKEQSLDYYNDNKDKVQERNQKIQDDPELREKRNEKNKEYQKKWAKENPEKYKEGNEKSYKNWKENNPEKYKGSWKKHADKHKRPNPNPNPMSKDELKEAKKRILQLRSEGWTWQEIGDEFNLTKQRVQAIANTDY